MTKSSEVALSVLERSVLRALFARRPRQLDQVERLRVVSRDYTGIGVFVNFSGDAGDDPTAPARELCRGIHADIPGNPIGLGFIAYLEHGRITSLEGYTYGGDDWPMEVPFFTLRDDPAQF